jgi:hypothetical protein
MSRSTCVTKLVGCDRNGTSHVRVESLDEVSINYITQPCSEGTVMAVTPGSADANDVANGKHLELSLLDMESS